MIRNYLKVAWRNLVKNRVTSLINIGGLAVGMAVAMLIGLWVWDEVSFNTYHKNYKTIGQIRTHLIDQRTKEQGVNGSMQFPIYTEFKSTYKENFKHIVM